MKRRESKILFNPVFINPQQVDHFLICRVDIAVYRLPKRPFCYIYVKVMTADERSYHLKIMVDNHVKSHNDWSNIKLMTSKG